MINDEGSGHLDSMNVRNTGARRTIRIFAIFAATIMLLMVFQVLAMPAFADDTTPDLPLSGTNPIDNSSSIPNLIDSIQSTSNSLPESGLQSFGSPQVTISDIGIPLSMPVMEETKNQISIRSSYGVYIINRSMPAILKVVNEKADIVVRESYFALMADNLALSVPDSQQLVVVNDQALVIRYNLTDSNSKYVGMMEMHIDYNETTAPKITASVLDVSSSLTGWSVYWQIAPLQDAMLRYDSLNMSLPLSAITGARPDSGELSTTVVGTSIDGSVATPVRIDINWSDAKSGLLNVQYSKLLSGEGGYTLQIQFDKSQSVIDPTIVVSGAISKSLAIMSQRKTFWYDGTYWVFYYTGTAICCKSSFDGNTWSSQQTIYTTAIANTLSGLPTGFDVAQKGNTVAIAWTAEAGTNDCLYFMNGTISYGTIKWNPRILVYNLIQAASPVSLAIGSDDSYWIASQTINGASYRFDVFHAMPGSSTFISELWDYALGGDVTGTFFVLPMANSRIALLEACYYRADVRVRYWCSPGWTSADLELPDLQGDDGLYTTYSPATFQNISAVATLDGTIYIAYKHRTDGYLGFAKYTPSSQSWTGTTIRSVSIEYPSISLDGNNNLHICYRTVSGSPSTYYVKHIEKPLSASLTSWTADDLIYSIQSYVIKDISTWITPVGYNGVIWTNMIGPNIQFASFPIPFGSAGASVDPWNREGLSPYGSYFSSFGSSVSPGTGLLIAQQNDANIPGRDGIDLGISRLYMEPKFFWKNGTPYMAPKYPYCNLGPGWSLDLPWFDGIYIGLPGGLRFVVRWGNTGNSLQFDNHDIVHFTLRSFYAGPVQYYELITASGVRYLFYPDPAGPIRLIQISDLRGFTPGSSSGGYSQINLSYDASGRLQYMTSSGLVRQITFTYNVGAPLTGLLNATTFPDGSHVNFNYVQVSGGPYVLSKVFDQKGRRTQYDYVSSESCILLNRTTFPTNGKIEYGYTKDSTAGTEVVSWLVTSVVTKNATGNSLIRYSTFLYRIVNGYITNTNQTNLNENRVIQSFTDYIFRSTMKCLIVTTRTSGGVQLLKTVTWFDTVGQPVKTDTYRGNTDQATYSEYAGYDDWGNAIFKRDATGQESYSAYSNTNSNNSFKGSSKFTLTSSGKIFFDAFDSWNISSWGKNTVTGTVGLDGSAYPPNSPSLKIDRTSTSAGETYAYRGIGAQANDFIMQFSFMTNTLSYSYFRGMSGGATSIYLRVNVYAYNGLFYWDDGTPHSFGSYQISKWYDVAFYVHQSSNKYDIYVNGTKLVTNAILCTSGNIDTLKFMAGITSGAATTLWIDNIRVYKSLTISLDFSTISVLGTTVIVQLFDSKGQLINTTRMVRTGPVYTAVVGIPSPRFDVPPCFIKVLIPGRSSFETPISEIWGGDSYTVTLGYSSSEITKNTNGYLTSIGGASMVNEGWPTGSWVFKSPKDQYEGNWTDSYANAASGNKYHVNKFANGTHYHGFRYNATSQMTVDGTDLLVNYIWLFDGKLPKEIMVQYFAYNQWYRAYWGGSDTKADLMDLSSSGLQPSSDHIRRIGAIPQTTGRWVQLVVKASDIFAGGGTYDIYGEIFGLYDGTARWDFSSKQYNGITINGLSGGQTVKMTFLNGTVATGTGTLYPYNAGMYAYPAQARIQILSGSTVLYTSSVIDEVMNGDTYTYSASNNNFYPMTIRGDLRVLPVASREYQDALGTICQESYVKYGYEGDAIETKSRLGSGWVYSQAGYDMYGNQLWAADQTGRMTVNEYSSSNYNTYPIATRYGGRQDVFEFDTSWQSSASASWLKAQYSTVNYYSLNHSLETSFTGAPSSPPQSNCYLWKEFKVNPIANLSVRIYTNTYSHNKLAGETLDAGIRIRLYNSGGSNYKTYEYWLACWNGASDNRTGYSNVKVIYGNSGATWKNPVLKPTSDFNIDWSSCDKVRFELYVNTTQAYGDSLKIYYDDFTYDDFASNSRTVYTYNNQNGTLASVRDPCGNVTSYVYDNLGRVKRIVYPDATNTTYIYDDAANKVTVLDELNQKTISYYDTIGRLFKTERYGTGTSMYSRELLTYNWLDKVATQTNARGYTYTMSYDCVGRLIKVTDPNGSVSTVSYDMISNTVNYTDAIGHSTVKVFDILGRLNSTREYYSPSAYYTTLNAYDAVGNLLTVKTSNGQVTRMAYDSLNRLTSTTYPDTYSESATYDEAGRPVTKTGRDSITSSFYYDTSGRLLRLVNPSDTISYTYNAVGQEMKVKNSLVTISYAYDVRGRLKSVYEPLETVGATYFTYDKAGNLKTLKYPNSVLITYNYDKYNRPTQVVYSGITLLTFTYNMDDSEATQTDEYGFVTTYTYDNLGRTTKILTTHGTTILSLNYTYDRVGNVRSINTENYTYDWLNRLTKAIGPWGTIQYGYDSVGNQLWKNENSVNTTYYYGGYSKLTSNGTYSFVYNRNGDLIWKNASTIRWNYVYNSMHQLTQVLKQTYSGGQWNLVFTGTYSYDGAGARARTADSVTSNYYYLGHDPIFATFPRENFCYVYVNGHLKADINNGNSEDFYFSDVLGGVRSIYQDGGLKFKVQSYKPFGGAWGVTDYFPGTYKQRFKFAGEMTDSTGIYYLSARYYDPDIGRFLSLDPRQGSLLIPQTMNRYVYCLNNPLRFIDPTGEVLPLIALAIIGLITASAAYGVVTLATGGELTWEGFAVAAVSGFVAGLTFGIAIPFFEAALGAGLAANVISGSLAGMAAGSAGYRAQAIWDFVAGQKVDFSPVGEFKAMLIGAIGGGFAGGIGYYVQMYIGPSIESLGLRFGSLIENVLPSSAKRIGSILSEAGISASELLVSTISGIPGKIYARLLGLFLSTQSNAINSGLNNIIGGIDISNPGRYSVSLNKLIGCTYSK